MKPKIRYSLCERVTAGPQSPHHIRQLTDVGMKKSGGADTAALCGAVVAWDVSELPFERVPRLLGNQHSSFRVCTTCAEAIQLLADA